MATETEEVLVSVSDLSMILGALHAAHMQSQARDLAEQYRKLSNRQQWSALTKELESSVALVDSYLKELDGTD